VVSISEQSSRDYLTVIYQEQNTIANEEEFDYKEALSGAIFLVVHQM
jgi:hypothetical protein